MNEIDEILSLSKQLKDEKKKTESLQASAKDLAEKKSFSEWENFKSFAENVKEAVPLENDFSWDENYSSDNTLMRVKNKIPLLKNSSGFNSAWIVNVPNIGNESQLVIIDSSYTGVRRLNKFEEVKEYFSDDTLLDNFKTNLKSFLKSNISQEQELQREAAEKAEAHRVDVEKAALDEQYKQIEKDFEITREEIVDLIDDIHDSSPEIVSDQLVQEVVYRLLEDSIDMHGFSSNLAGRGDVDTSINSSVMAAHSVILEEAANAYVCSKRPFNTLQEFVDDRLKANFLYQQLEIQGILTDFVEKKEEPSLPRVRVYSFEPFGYEGFLVASETDLRRGIPAVDIVGLADEAVKESRAVIKAAFRNSCLIFPAERVLISLSPEDQPKKTGCHSLAIALSVMGNAYPDSVKLDGPVLAMGDLALSGEIKPVRGIRAAAKSSRAAGITKVIWTPADAEVIRDIEGLEICTVENLEQAKEVLRGNIGFEKNIISPEQKKERESIDVKFTDDSDITKAVKSFDLMGYSKTCEAIEAAVAGKHSLYLSGAPGSGKTMLSDGLIPYLTPKLTYSEAQARARIENLAGYTDSIKSLAPSFRMPHQSAGVEGICGGGPVLKPGEVSLAHNGILFLDEASEFRSSVLQMIDIVSRKKEITLSRAGRSTVFPANFQLVAAANPCACGNGGVPGHVCLCSLKAVDQYESKLSYLSNNCEVKNFVFKDPTDRKKVSLDKMRERIACAYKIQRQHGKYNKDLTPMELKERINFTKEMNEYLSQAFPQDSKKGENSYENSINSRNIINAMRLSLTVANLDGRENVTLKDLVKAVEMGRNTQVQSQLLNKKLNKELAKEQGREGR